MFDDDNMEIPEDDSVLCVANSYISKFYFNPKYAFLPSAVKEELQKICVSLTEEAGGFSVMSFDDEGELTVNSFPDESDFYYDNVSAGLLVNKIERENRDLFHSLTDYYRVKYLDLPPVYDDEDY